MASIVSSFLPFPSLAWWAMILPASTLRLDEEEPFRKMTYRNRYYLCGPSGWMALTIPVQGGREQKTPMKDMLIDQGQPWARQHWRTLSAAYGRSPYFSHYAPQLQALFDTPARRLTDFHLHSIHWLAEQIGFPLPGPPDPTQAAPKTEERIDLRPWRPGIEKKGEATAPYVQVFGDRNPFYPNLSLLDLLFQEGPNTLSWIRNHPFWMEQWIPEPAKTSWKTLSSSIPRSSPPG